MLLLCPQPANLLSFLAADKISPPSLFLPRLIVRALFRHPLHFLRADWHLKMPTSPAKNQGARNPKPTTPSKSQRLGEPAPGTPARRVWLCTPAGWPAAAEEHRLTLSPEDRAIYDANCAKSDSDVEAELQEAPEYCCPTPSLLSAVW